MGDCFPNLTKDNVKIEVRELVGIWVWLGPDFLGGAIKTHPATLLLAELSAICELAIHLVSPTTVLACGRRPTSFTVIIKCRDDFRTLTASSCGMLKKLRPFTSRIWSPTCRGGREQRGVAGGAEQGGEDGPGRDCHIHRFIDRGSETGSVTDGGGGGV